LLGYASVLDQLAVHVLQSGEIPCDCGLNVIISGSERLAPEVHERLLQAFDCGVFSRYSNQENGIIAQQYTNAKHDFIVNHASDFIELLDLDDDIPAKDGEMARIVLTDFYNDAFPVIRYDTGDLVTFQYTGGRLYFTDVCGRKVDYLYDVADRKISPFLFTSRFSAMKDIMQYQIIQSSKAKYTVRLLHNDGVQINKNDILELMRPVLGRTADITFEYVNDIPQMSSGKFKLIVREYEPDAISS